MTDEKLCEEHGARYDDESAALFVEEQYIHTDTHRLHIDAVT